jgi:hypothetical protein
VADTEAKQNHVPGHRWCCLSTRSTQ